MATLSKHDLKQPDEFITWGTRAAAFAEKNLVVVVIGTLLPLLAVGAIFAMSYNRDQREMEAAGKLWAGEKKLQGDAQQGQFRGLKIPGMNEPKPEDLQAAIATFAQVATEYPGTKAERRAHLLAADTYYGMEKFDESAKEYDAASNGGTDMERYYALSGKAHSLEAKKTWDDAAGNYRKIVDDPAMINRDLAALDLSRVLVKAGKTDDAKALLAKFTNDYPNSALKDDASTRLTELGGTPAPASTAKPESN